MVRRQQHGRHAGLNFRAWKPLQRRDATPDRERRPNGGGLSRQGQGGLQRAGLGWDASGAAAALARARAAAPTEQPTATGDATQADDGARRGLEFRSALAIGETVILMTSPLHRH